MKLSWRGGRSKRERIYLDRGRRPTQLMRDSLDSSAFRSMTTGTPMISLPFTRLGLLTALLTATSQAQVVTVNGQVLDTGYPVNLASVRVSSPTGAWLDSTVTDSTGRFEFSFPFQPGCYRLQVRYIGAALTERTFSVTTPGVRELDSLSIRSAPIPEWPGLLFLECAYSQAGKGPWGTDTI
jgi:hypothetical protein